jgi:uncharacterized protein (TIGR02271 family)
MDSDSLIPEDKDAADVIPVLSETINIEKLTHESAVTIHKTVDQRTEVVDLPLQSEEVEVERVPVNRIVEAPIPVRYEGDTMIISLLEEVLVVEKRLVLREEVHIRKLHTEVHDPKEVLLREEHVEITRDSSTKQEARHD